MAFTDYIYQMYIQVLIAPDDQDVQRIVGRESAYSAINEYWLKTVTYGMPSVLFLAISCLIQIGKDIEKMILQ